MNDPLKLSCLAALRAPQDQFASLQAIVKEAGKEDPFLVEQLRPILDGSAAEPNRYRARREWSRLTKVPSVVLRVLRFTTTVLFACECARRVLPLFERHHPDVKQPREFLKTAEAWARTETTDQVVSEKFEKLTQLAEDIERDWDWAYEMGALDPETQERLRQSASHIFALSAVTALGRAIIDAADASTYSDSPEAALRHIDDLVDHCIEVELIENAPAMPFATVTWMNELLIELVEREPTNP